MEEHCVWYWISLISIKRVGYAIWQWHKVFFFLDHLQNQICLGRARDLILRCSFIICWNIFIPPKEKCIDSLFSLHCPLLMYYKHEMIICMYFLFYYLDIFLFSLQTSEAMRVPAEEGRMGWMGAPATRLQHTSAIREYQQSGKREGDFKNFWWFWHGVSAKIHTTYPDFNVI